MVVLGVSATSLPGRRQITRAFAENSNNGSAPSSVRVRFSVKQRVKYGQHVAIVGSNPALGEWNPDRRVALEWTDGDRWTAAVEVPPGEVELKFVVVDGEAVKWLPGDNVRVPCTAPEVVVEAEGLDAGGGVKIKTNSAAAAPEKVAEKKDVVKEAKAVAAFLNGDAVAAAAPAAAPTAAAAAAAPVKLAVSKLTVPQLKERAKELGLSTKGKKAELVARIEAALE